MRGGWLHCHTTYHVSLSTASVLRLCISRLDCLDYVSVIPLDIASSSKHGCLGSLGEATDLP